MKKFRLWLVLMAFFLTAGISKEAECAESADEIRKVQTESEDQDGDGIVDKITDYQQYVNPEFEHLVSDDEIIDLFQENAVLSKDANVTYYTSVQAAVAELKNQLVARNELIYIGLKQEDYHNSLPGEMFMMAMEHSGVGREGDYLVSQYSNCHISGEWIANGTGWNVKLAYQPQYHTNAVQEAAVDQKLVSVMQSLNLAGKDEYTKAKAIYDYICDNVTYDYVNLGNNAYKLQYTAYAALINGTSVCNGYAALFYRMALEAGLNCRYLSGMTDDGELHAWNIVEIGGRYYNLDAAWDAGRSSQNWFLKSMETFVNHNRDENYAEKSFQIRYPMSLTDYQVGGNNTEVMAQNGSCGTGLVWSVDAAQCLTITGTGAMFDYSDASPAPWSRYKLSKVVISEGVTTIGSKAFAYQNVLKEVVLPGTITVIGKEAFSNCKLLSNIVLPGVLGEIGEKAFYRCALTGSLAIPASVRVIRAYAFAENAGITALVLPNGLTSVEDFAFLGCSVLESLTYPAGLGGVSTNVFSGCANIKYVTLTGSGEMADYTADNPAPFNRSTVQSVMIQEGITSVGDYAFQNASALKTVTFPSSLKKIGVRAFKWCKNLETVVLPNGLTDIGEFAFYECTGLKTFTMPISAVNVQNSAFSYCSNVEQLTLTGSGAMKDYAAVTDTPWCYLVNLKKVIIEEGITHIGSYAFYSKEALVSVEVPSTVRTIGGYAFAFCDVLSGITNWDQLTSIGEYSFYGCPKLTIKAKEGTAVAEYASKNKLNFQSTGLMTPAWKDIQNTAKGIKLSWNKVSGASGYRIYRRSGNGEWKKLANIKSGSKTSYVDASVKSGTFYAYRICALKNGKIASDYSLTNANSVYLSVPKLTEVKNTSGKKLQVKWKKVKGIGGYEIRYVTGKTVKTVQVKKNKVSRVLSGLKKKKTYKISIRTYKKVNNVVWYSAWSNVKKVKVTR